MRYNPDIHHRLFLGLPGQPEKPIIVQIARISDIRDAVFHPGAQPDGQSMENRVFSQTMFAVPFLSDDEMVQVNRFKALKKQMEWVCGRFALKTLARDVLDLDLPLKKSGSPIGKGCPVSGAVSPGVHIPFPQQQLYGCCHQSGYRYWSGD
ncbi:MAG: hypothetical protein U5J62_07410 [Desulfurivibrio sp.]|nr:hypothetical protein [Desulfurivibrio sp.]